MNESSNDEPIRVFHLLHTMDYGGVETIIINFLRTFDPKQVESTVVCFANPGGTEHLFVEAATAAGFQVHKIPWNRRKPILRSSNELGKLVKQYKPHIIHTHNTYADLVGLVTAKRHRLGTVSSLYVLSNFGWKRKALEWITLQALRHFDCVTAQCEATKRDICAGGIRPEKVEVLHSGFPPARTILDPAAREALRQSHGISPDEVLMVNVARLYPEKAQDILLEEFRVIRDARPNARLWFMGRGPCEEALKAKCTELGLDDAVAFLGFIPNPEERVQEADIQVHPSHTEGIPLAMLQGMAVGLPIIISDVGGIAEVLKDDVNGILVPPAGDPEFREAFRSNVIRLIDDAAERRRIGDEARRFIEGEYSLENAAAVLVGIYNKVLAT